MNIIKRYLLKRYVNKGSNNLEKFYMTLSYVKWLLQYIDATNKDENLLPIDKSLLEEGFNPFGLLPTVNRNIKFKSIVVEGNDISGKETYTKHLESTFSSCNYSKNSDGENIVVELLSFPNYNSVIGKEIARLLRVKNKTIFDINVLNWLFILDRKNTILHQIRKYNRKNRYKYNVILIFDRFYLSNYVYNMDKYPDIAYHVFVNENRVYKNDLRMHEYMIFTRDDIDHKHDELIKNKTDKDENETIEYQKKIALNYKNRELESLLRNHDVYATYPRIRYYKISDVICENGVSNFRSPYYFKTINHLALSVGIDNIELEKDHCY